MKLIEQTQSYLGYKVRIALPEDNDRQLEYKWGNTPPDGVTRKDYEKNMLQEAFTRAASDLKSAGITPEGTKPPKAEKEITTGVAYQQVYVPVEEPQSLRSKLTFGLLK